MRNIFKCTVLAAVLCLLLGSTYVMADKDITVNLNGNPIAFDVKPSIINDRVMVPMRAIFEAMKANVSWDQDTKTIFGSKGSTIIVLQIDNQTAYVNGRETPLEAAPTIVNGRTLVPARFIADSLGADVKWDPATYTVDITMVEEAADQQIN